MGMADKDETCTDLGIYKSRELCGGKLKGLEGLLKVP